MTIQPLFFYGERIEDGDAFFRALDKVNEHYYEIVKYLKAHSKTNPRSDIVAARECSKLIKYYEPLGINNRSIANEHEKRLSKITNRFCSSLQMYPYYVAAISKHAKSLKRVMPR